MDTWDKLKGKTQPRAAVCQSMTKKEEELLSNRCDIGARGCCVKFFFEGPLLVASLELIH